MRRRVLTLAGLQAAGAAALASLAWATGTLGRPSLAVIPSGVAIAVVGSRQINVELGRHACSVTMVEALVVALLLYVDPAGVVVAAVLGEMLTSAWQRQSPLKLSYNSACAALAASVAAVVFLLLRGRSDGTAWAAALVAATGYATTTLASTSAVLSVVEGRRFRRVFGDSLAPVAAASGVSATLGLVAVVLAGVSPGAALLIAPLVLVMVSETRRLSSHRAEHLRFERLYAASSRTGNLQGLPDVLASLADEARWLVTGAAGVCCTRSRDGAWQAMLVGDTEVAPAPPELLAAILGLAPGPGSGETRDLPDAVHAVLPATESVVFARSDEGGAPAPVVLAVLRQLGGDDGARSRAEVLGAFMGHAALTVANARLYADVEDALAHQIDLNRQKDDFVAVVSHELRTPLASVLGAVSTLQRLEARLGPEQRAALVDIAIRQGERLKRLIEEMLLLANVENGGQAVPGRDPVDLARMVDEIASALASRHGREAEVDVRLSDHGSPALRTDEHKLGQVLSNLVDNAFKYAPGSPILVDVSGGDDQVRIEVVDHGPGIPPAERERVFERFVQLDQSSTRAQGGTGIGLYLCRQLAGLLGGSLTLSEAGGGGCRFTLTLPAALPQPGGPERPGEARPLAAAAARGA